VAAVRFAHEQLKAVWSWTTVSGKRFALERNGLGLLMTITKLVFMLVCLMSVTLSPAVHSQKPKEAKVAPLLSKDLTDIAPGKEGLM